jgi:hypothetical protein
MSNVPSIDISGLLVAAGVGQEGPGIGWRIFIGSEPDEDEANNIPDTVITIYDTPGDAPHPKFRLDYPRFQVRVRANDYLEGINKLEECKSALLGLPSQTINGTIYEGIWSVTDTGFLRKDEKGRSIFASTFRIIREPSDGTHRLPL